MDDLAIPRCPFDREDTVPHRDKEAKLSIETRLQFQPQLITPSSLREPSI